MASHKCDMVACNIGKEHKTVFDLGGMLGFPRVSPQLFAALNDTMSVLVLQVLTFLRYGRFSST